MSGRPDESDPDREIARALRLRSPPAPVVRLSRRAVVIACGAAALAIAGVTTWSLTGRAPRPPSEPPVGARPAEARPPEQLASLPKDYADLPPGVPRLGPPLPGDLGRPILAARGGQREPWTSSDGAGEALAARRQAQDAERTAGRTSRLFVSSAAASAGASSPAAVIQAPGDAPRPVAEASSAPAPLRGSHVLPAGSALRAALVTGIRSDLPGPVTAQVTEDVRDLATGEVVLIPRGSRLLGAYDSKVAFGQSRVLLTWSRLVLPDGRSLDLDQAAATDGQGFAGLQDRVDRHWRQLIGASLVSLGVAAAGDIGRGAEERELAEALRRALGDTASQVGGQVIGRSLAVQPTLTVRPGVPVRVLLTRDLALEAWRAP